MKTNIHLKLKANMKTKFLSKTACLLCTLLLLCTFQDTWANPIDEEEYDYVFTICLGESIELEGEILWATGPIWDDESPSALDDCNSDDWLDPRPTHWMPSELTSCSPCLFTIVAPTVTTVFTGESSFTSIVNGCPESSTGAVGDGATDATGASGDNGDSWEEPAPDVIYDLDSEHIETTYLIIVDSTCSILPDPCETCMEQANEPVCGSDGNTYYNTCEAECAGVEVVFNGACEDIDHIYTICPGEIIDLYANPSEPIGPFYSGDEEDPCDDGNWYDVADFDWTPAEFVECPTCEITIVSPTVTTLFTSQMTFESISEEFCVMGAVGATNATGPYGYTEPTGAVGYTETNHTDDYVEDVCGTDEFNDFYDYFNEDFDVNYDTLTFTFLVIVDQTCNVTQDPCDTCTDQPYTPVCGADGITYYNACQAECAGVEILSEGECIVEDPCDTCTEQANEPVCGSDGNTYFNTCEAECAGVEILSDGECTPEPDPCETCIQQAFDPVCDEDGNTYYNTCEAECAGAFNTTSGTCMDYDYVLTICAGDSVTLEEDHFYYENCYYPDECGAVEYDILPVNWSPADLAGCNVCDYPVISPTTTTVFTAYSSYVCQPCTDGPTGAGASGQFTTTYLVIVVQGCNEDYQPPVASCASCVEEDYAPVCDGEGNTYYNACEAECLAGIGVYYDGICDDATATLNFTEHPWLNDVIDPTDPCSNQSVTEYSNGSYSYIYVEANDDCEGANDVLYYNGVVFCESGYFDCFDLYDLDDFEATTLWTSPNTPVPCTSTCGDAYAPVCGADGNTYDNTCLAECAGVEVVDCETNNTAPNFEEFPWLNDIVDTQDCCNNSTVIQYTNGAYSYIYLTGDDGCEGTFDALYYNGSLFCESDYLDCFDFYDLADFEAITLWSCNGDDDDGGNQNNNEPNFENFPWLNDIVDVENCCDDALVTEYTNGAYSFIYVEANPDCSDAAPTLYYNGNMHCDGENFDCFELYDLADFTANILWACGDNMGKYTSTQTATTGLVPAVNAKVYPNPTQNVLNVGTVGFDMENLHIQMMDYTGRVIQSLEANSPTLQIQTSDLQAGTYILLITDGSQSLVQKFVKVD